VRTLRVLRLRHRRRRGEQHGAYVDALLRELELERSALAPELETIFLGAHADVHRAARARTVLDALPLPPSPVEANPETVTPELACALRAAGVTRVSARCPDVQPTCSACSNALPDLTTSDAPCIIFVMARFDNISLEPHLRHSSQTAADLCRRSR